MAKKEALNVAFLWHHHQPYYKDARGVYQMPWVRFHATKDYLDLLQIVAAFPGVQQCFNLVPSLLLQIQDYIQNNSRDTVWLLSEIPAGELNTTQKQAILNTFFLADEEYIVKPLPRYHELFTKFAAQSPEQSLSTFDEQDFRDLQICYNLAWIGPVSREAPPLQALLQKGRNFSEADKTVLFAEIRKILEAIVPAYKTLWHSGQIELTASPFYHPILPLLIDSNIANVAAPDIELPTPPFQHPEDARTQIKRGIKFLEKLFEQRPQGMWPPEGAISADAAQLLVREKIRWMVTDENILIQSTYANSPAHQFFMAHYYPMKPKGIHIFFRHHYLSEAINFVYATWDAKSAVEDFFNRLHSIREEIVAQAGSASLADHLVTVVCEGENSWEHYPNNGRDFLERLFQQLQEDPLVSTCTFSEFLDRKPQTPTLDHLHPGSRMHPGFNIWIAGEEDRKAWDWLKKTRDFLEERDRKGVLDREVRREAWEQIYIAEGSDWCWWYGDEHSSLQDLEFDRLFREHLMRVYELCNGEIPGELFKTIKRTHFDRFAAIRPLNYIHPKINGQVDGVQEWAGAAVYDSDKTLQTAIPQSERIINKLYVGFDRKNLYLRVDFYRRIDIFSELVISVKIPRAMNLVVSPLRGVIEKFEPGSRLTKRQILPPRFRMIEVCEIALAFKNLHLTGGETFGFQIMVKEFGQTRETFPHAQMIEITIPSGTLKTAWSA